MARKPSLDPESRRKLEVTLAVATQRAHDVHVRQALELVTHSHGRVPVERALGIYSRIHGLPGELERTLASRVLAALGEADLGPDTAEAPREDLIGRIRRRLRGRRDLQLRRWVEFHKGRTDRDLVDVHVEAIARVDRELSEVHSVADAVAWYAEAAGLSGAMRDNVYLAALARLDETTGRAEAGDMLAQPRALRRKAGGSGGRSAPGPSIHYRAVGD